MKQAIRILVGLTFLVSWCELAPAQVQPIKKVLSGVLTVTRTWSNTAVIGTDFVGVSIFVSVDSLGATDSVGVASQDDTTGTAIAWTRGRLTLAPVYAKWFRVRTGSGTAKVHYAVNGSIDAAGDPSTLLSMIARLDTMYAWHEFSLTDSIVTGSNYTAGAAGKALNDSTTNPKLLVWTLPWSGFEGQITDCQMTADSANIKSLRNHIYNDSTGSPRVPDGTAIPFKASNIQKRIGYVDVTVSGNTATAAGIGQATFVGLTFSALPSNKLYGLIEHLTSNAHQKNEHILIKIKGFARRPLP